MRPTSRGAPAPTYQGPRHGSSSSSGVSFVAASTAQVQFEQDELQRIATQGPSMMQTTDSMAILREVQRTASVGTSGIGYYPQAHHSSEIDERQAKRLRPEVTVELPGMRNSSHLFPAPIGVFREEGAASSSSMVTVVPAEAPPLWTHKSLMNPLAPGALQRERERLTVAQTTNFVAILEPLESSFAAVHYVVLPRDPTAPAVQSLAALRTALLTPPAAGGSNALGDELRELILNVTRMSANVRVAMVELRRMNRQSAATLIAEIYCQRGKSASTTTSTSDQSAPSPSLVFRCGFFRTQVDTVFDMPCAFHIMSADLQGARTADRSAKLWNAVFCPEHLLSIDDLVSTPLGQEVASEDMRSMVEVRRKLAVCTPMTCPVCRKPFPEVADLWNHWRKKCLVSLSTAGGGDAISV